MYCKELTKKMLEDYGITNVTDDGRIFKGGKELKYHIVISNLNKPYSTIVLCDYSKKRYYGNSYTYKSVTIGVHRAMWAWFNNSVPSGYVVDHIDNDSLHNELSNLQLLTPKENLSKDRKYFGSPIKCNMNKPREFYTNKIDELTNMYECAKANKEQGSCHHLRTILAEYKRKLEYYDLHIDEYMKSDEHRKYELKIIKKYAQHLKKSSNNDLGNRLMRFIRTLKTDDLRRQYDYIIIPIYDKACIEMGI